MDTLTTKPLIVASVSDEEIGREMSNFGEFPFYFGKKPIRYNSVESFYQMLTEPDEKVRKRIAKMTGKEAKHAGRSQTLDAKFEGKIYALGSEAHHDLIKDAIRAKLNQHPELARRFVDTHPRTIIHITPGAGERALSVRGVLLHPDGIARRIREEVDFDGDFTT